MQQYCDYNSVANTAELFNKWTALTVVSAALERKVWANLTGGKLYPNLYTMLVAPPGIGKDQAINPAVNMMREAGGFSLAPISVTSKGLLDAVAAPSAIKDFRMGLDLVRYHTMFVAVPEFGTLLEKHDLGFLSILNELYNCGPLFEEQLRSRQENLRIENPHMVMLTGTQPSYMASMFPEEAWGMGFFARTILVYWGTATKREMFGQGMFGEDKERMAKEKALIKQLKDMKNLIGAMDFTSEAQASIEHFNVEESEVTAPTHPRLFNYNTRRTLHLIKISMVLAGAQLRRTVTEEMVEEAKSLMYEVEELMPEIFKEMTQGSHKSFIDEAYFYLVKLYQANGRKPVPEHKLVQILTAKVPVQQIHFVIKTMLDGKMIREASQSDDPKTKLLAAFNKLQGSARYFEPVALTVV